MASRPLRVCTHKACSNLVRGGGQCPAHARTPWANRPHWRERYGNAWPQTRKRILERDGNTCQAKGCGKFGDTVDHKTPRFEGGTNDDSNLETLCRTCQQRKANEEANRARARKREGGVGSKVHTLKRQRTGVLPPSRTAAKLQGEK